MRLGGRAPGVLTSWCFCVCVGIGCTELNDLLRDLKNLENLESRIEMQRKYNEDKLGLMRSEMGKYEDLDGLKREAESSMKVFLPTPTL